MYFLPVYPLGTILTIGITAEDSDTWLKPIARAMFPISFSWASYLVQNNVQINNCEIWKKKTQRKFARYRSEGHLHKMKATGQEQFNTTTPCKQLFLMLIKTGIRVCSCSHDQRRIKHQWWHFNLYLLYSKKQLEIS